jgi:hypothetical protein
VRDDLSTLPTTLVDFTNPASTLGQVKASKTFSNTLIAAANINKLRLGAVTTGNAGTAFGVSADSIASLKATTLTQKIKLKNAALSTDSIAEDDFDVVVL